MTINDELTSLRLDWDANGVPRDAYSQISAVLDRHVGHGGPGGHAPRRGLTGAELERCGRCGLPRISHERLSGGCPGAFSDSPGAPPARREIWDE
ncbi:MAG TPA: hypothetical protein ENH33_07305 [Actinobacteria bacterium]|nr:hypothetical protein [Actinomycetota bacterium]